MSTSKPRIRKAETAKPSRGDRQARGAADLQKTSKESSSTTRLEKPLSLLRWPLKIVGYIVAPRYVRNAFKELGQVTWPSWKKTWSLTFAVLIFAVVFGALITITDYGLDKLIRRIVLR